MQLGAVAAEVVDAREEFARDYVVPAIKANAIYGARLPAVHRARPAAHRQARRRLRAPPRLRHDRPRLHRQGQRPGPHRGDDRHARARAEGHRAGPRLADGPRGGDRVRAQARHPDQGRRRADAVLDRRQPLGPLARRARWIEDLSHAPDDDVFQLVTRPEEAPDEAADRRDRVRARASRSRSTASASAIVELLERAAAARDQARRRDRRPHRGPDRRPEGPRHLRGPGRGDPAARARRARAARRHDPPEPVQAASSTASGPTSSTPGLWWEPLRTDLDAYMDSVNEQVTGTIGMKLYKGSARVVTRASPERGLRRRSSRRSRPPAGCSPSRPRRASSSCGRCSRGWPTDCAPSATGSLGACSTRRSASPSGRARSGTSAARLPPGRLLVGVGLAAVAATAVALGAKRNVDS